ncbi:RDD family protein [Massilia sp. CF038]|uniref:RDD family protein n=1 Tax=Massilia sp. CF038 TaxID=1881045 RepID=UPI0009238CDA|nr:RDD family protein [Massilia sp. CF038]SHG56515.1 RDD family protein [Massilia sp. CF038]
MTAQFNPYQSPTALADAPADVEQLRQASKWIRFFTFLIDYFFYTLAAFVCGFIAALIGPAAIAAIQAWNGFLFSVALFIVYYAAFESIWARTPGKFILGTKVMTETGGVPGFGTIMKRTLSRFIPFEAFSYFGDRGWHDEVAKTVVIRTR